MEKLTNSMRVTEAEKEFLILCRSWSLKPWQIATNLSECMNGDASQDFELFAQKFRSWFLILKEGRNIIGKDKQ